MQDLMLFRDLKPTPCIQAVGPKNAKIAIVGEAPGEQEELTGIPFIGTSGQEMNRMLEEARLQRNQIYLTNVLWTRPPNNKIESFLVKKAECPSDYNLPPLRQGGYLHPALLPELDRLKAELEALRPNVTIACGNTAVWALLGTGKISTVRGAVAESTLVPGLKVLPTYHPAAVLRNWEYRPIVIADFIKAGKESLFPEIRRPERVIKTDPELWEVQAFIPEALSAPIISLDIETHKKTITMVGIATSPSYAFVLPFMDPRKQGWNYWDRIEDELEAWKALSEICAWHPWVVCQNGLYDVQYLWRMGIPVPGFRDDTMILHHAMYPELPKSLGFLGSIYTNEASWKLMRLRGDHSNKRDE